MGLFDFLSRKKRSSVSRFPLYTKGGVCDVCGQSLSSKEAFSVPNKDFYASKQYLEFYTKTSEDLIYLVRNSQQGASKLSDKAIAESLLLAQQSQDKSEGSAVCINCIHMFR